MELDLLIDANLPFIMKICPLVAIVHLPRCVYLQRGLKLLNFS